MQPDLRLIPKPTVTVTARLCGVTGLLRMTNDELTRHLSDMAARNPLLEVKAGAPGPASGQGIPAVAAQDSLCGHVMRQIGVRFDNSTDLKVAIAFADVLEPSGWISEPVQTVADRAGVTLRRAEAVLARLQQFEPTGVFARDLSDCLRLQLIEHGHWSEDVAAVLAALGAFLDGGLDAVADASDLPVERVSEVLSAIRACNPKPGAAFQADDPGLQRRPDVIVSKQDTGWEIELARSTLPSVDLRDSGRQTDPVLARLRADARWLVSAVQMRNRMTLDVARAVVRYQVGFLERGIAGLRPLRRQDIADRLGVHESTVCRVATGLLVQTPSQMLELTRFFSRALGRQRGAPTSRRKIHLMLRDLIGAEDRSAPLSDRALRALLSDEGVKISRRTVAKYRAALGIKGAPDRLERAGQGASTTTDCVLPRSSSQTSS